MDANNCMSLICLGSHRCLSYLQAQISPLSTCRHQSSLL